MGTEPDKGTSRSGQDRLWDPEGGSLLVAYGTLLNRASLAATVGEGGMEKRAVPVIVQGFQRRFNLRPSYYEPSYHLTQDPSEVGALNVQRVTGTRFNGLALQLSAEELAALDERERYYDRIRTEVCSFPDGRPLGEAYLYSAASDSPWVVDNPDLIRPHWRDIVWARQGAYAQGRSFGEMFDATTFLAGGTVLALDEYRDHLPPVEGS